MSIDKNHELSNFVPDRLPEFVRIDHPVLVSFLGAYYEWLGIRRNEGKILSPLEMHDIPDIDTTLDQFVDSFKAEYLLNFPENLAIDPETKQSVDVRKLIKNIKQFYLAKGTEKTYEFLFHILYNTSVEFYYPKKDILVLSGGKWTQNNYLRISTNLGEDIHRASGNIITQKNQNGEILASARVVEVTTFQIDNFGVAELLINGRNGTFQAGNLGIDFTEGGQELHETSVFSVVSSVKIVNGGSDYEIGDRVTFVPFPSQNDGLVDSGQQANGTVLETDSLGGIRKIAINDFGINYKTPPKCVVESVKGTGFNSHVFVGSLCQSPGYYANFDGRLSTDKVMQDNHFYQNWSYVLKTEVMIDKFREIIRRLVHPVGIGMFGSVLIKRCASADLENASSLMSFHTPIIGHYTPYTFNTFDDLSLWFMEGLTGTELVQCGLSGGTGCNDLRTVGYSPSHHDMYIQSAGQGLVVAGNPISNNIPFPQWAATGSSYLALPNFPNADPFWIIYQHPNKMVAKGLHIAKIWNTQLNDFVGSTNESGGVVGGWGEWSYLIENWRNEDQTEWIRQLRNTIPLSAQTFVPDPGCACECSSFEGNPCPCIYGEEGVDCGCGSGNICEGGRERRCCCIDVPCETCLGDDQDPCVCTPCADQCGGSTNPCCGSSDPCCNPLSPCCGNPDPCTCMGDVPCCGDNPDPCCSQNPIDPCCMNPNPCCGSSDPCCGNPDPCCGSSDPCCGSTDPCCGITDPCTCNPTSPCCTDPDGCVCAPNGPCCGDHPPACCDPRNPCCNSPDPCCDPDGPCCGSTDPCCDPESDCCLDPTGLACCQNCSPFCTNPTCVCDPCQAECGGGSCNPACPGYDPCVCDPGGNDCCAADPCNPLCPDSCECGTADPCVCEGDGCVNTQCPAFDWCKCYPEGLTCCALNPCKPCNINFDPCEPTCPLFDPCATGCSGYGPCTPQCVSFDPCSTGCSGYGPCHPWCDTSFCATGCSGGGVCNPFCPLFDACNTGCASYDPSFCCNGCNCGGGGGIGRVIYRDPPIAGTRGVPPVYDPNENNPCFGVRGNCAFGTMNQEQYDFKYALLEYNENSEFRKITARAFFNMPQGQQFNCRQETISNVITPTFNILYPLLGNIASNPALPVLTSIEDYNFFKNLIVNFTILNEENLQYYGAKKIIVYLDGKKRIESQMNTRQIVLSNMTNGRHTLKMEMHDSDDRLIAGTQSIVVFAYEFVSPVTIPLETRMLMSSVNTRPQIYATSWFSTMGNVVDWSDGGNDNDPVTEFSHIKPIIQLKNNYNSTPLLGATGESVWQAPIIRNQLRMLDTYNNLSNTNIKNILPQRYHGGWLFGKSDGITNTADVLSPNVRSNLGTLIWPDNEILTLQNDWQGFLNVIDDNKNNSDGLLMAETRLMCDNEFVEYSNNFNMNEPYFNALKADPRYDLPKYGAESLKSQLEADGITNIQWSVDLCGASGCGNPFGQNYLKWNKATKRISNSAFSEALWKPFNDRYANGYDQLRGCNWECNIADFNDAYPDANGHDSYINTIFGDSANIHLYGRMVNGSTAWTIDLDDSTKLIRRQGENQTIFTVVGNPWYAFLISVQGTRAVKRGLINKGLDTTSIIAWIAPKDWTGDGSTTVGFVNTEYYDENIRHASLTGIEIFGLFNGNYAGTDNTSITNRRNQFSIVNDIFVEVNNKLGGYTPSTLDTSRVSYNAEYVISGAPTSTGQYLWRITLKDESKDISIDGEIVPRIGEEVGVWVVTNTIYPPTISILNR